MAVYTETIELKDNVSGAAEKAAKEMSILEGAIASTENALTKAAATGNIKKYQALSKDLEGYKSALSTIPPVQSEMTASLDKTSSSGAGFQAELAEMTGGLSILVEAVGAVVIGFAALTIAGAAFAIKASEAKNASLSLWTALGKGEITGNAVDDMLDELRASTGLTKDSLAPLAEGFLRMGITGKEALQGLTTAAASAEALAKGGGDAFTKLYQQAKIAGETGSKLTIPYKKLENQLVSMGLNVDDLAKSMGMSGTELTKGLKAGSIDAKKFGDAMQDAVTKKGVGPLENLANSSANLGKLLQEYIGDLFEDFGKDIAPFMKEVKSLFSILDSKANPSGQALKQGIGAFFKEVFAMATKVVPMIKHFLLDVVIYGLKAYLAIKPIVKTFNEWRNSATGIKVISTIIDVISAALIVVGAVIGIVVIAFVALWAIMVGIGIVIWAVIAAFIAIPQMAGKAIYEFFAKAPQMALDFINGLVSGITSGATFVVDAVKGLAGGAVSAFKGALGISSPSKVMMEMGGHFAGGAAAGIEEGKGEISAASSGLAGAAAGSFAPSGGGGGKSGGGGVTITIEAGAIAIAGAGKAASEITEEMISLIFERVALAQGL